MTNKFKIIVSWKRNQEKVSLFFYNLFLLPFNNFHFRPYLRPMKIGVVVFPGSNCDEDMIHILRDVLRMNVIKLLNASKNKM